MNYWLMKSEPEDFSLEDLKNRPQQLEPWTGVRNYQARNFMRDAMSVGDPIFFYHSNIQPPGIAGLAEVASEPFPDPTAFDARSKYFDPRAGAHGTTWVTVNVKYVETFPRLISLDELRRIPGLGTMGVLQRGSRLSIQPVTAKEFKIVTDWIRKHPEPLPEAAPARPAAAPRGKRPK
jgi:predicted RNA-binding protein with PUA-like domain